MSSYLDVCNHFYNDWLSRKPTFRSLTAQKIFSSEHVPEPYLLFGTGSERAIWVTTNPGQGYDFQLRPADSATSLFLQVGTYEEAASRLGAFYAAPTAPITAAARANIASMLRISQILGSKRSAMQVETYPWHSPNLPNKNRLDVVLSKSEPRFSEYQRELRHFLNEEEVVLAWCAGTPNRRGGAGMDLKANTIGLDLQSAQLLPLEITADVSQALLWSRNRGRFRGLFVTQGAATLPSAGFNRQGQRKDELIESVLRS